MRRILKGQPPVRGIRSGNWTASQQALAVDLNSLPSGPARTARARAQFKDSLSGSARDEATRGLCDEQRSLCVFCERSVAQDVRDKRAEIRVAHWTPVEADPGRALDWRNLFASCSDPNTCDTHQENRSLEFDSPADQDWSRHLRFDGSTGAMSPTLLAQQAFAAAIALGTGLWNLNQESLQRARRAAMATEREIVIGRRRRGAVPIADVLRARIEVHERDPRQFQSAILFLLRSWLDRQR